MYWVSQSPTYIDSLLILRLGADVYNYASTDDYAATNHMGSYSVIEDIFGNRGLTWWFAAEENIGLLHAARQDMFLPDVNNTKTPGLQRRCVLCSRLRQRSCSDTNALASSMTYRASFITHLIWVWFSDSLAIEC